MKIAYLFSYDCPACFRAKKEGLIDDISLRFKIINYDPEKERYRGYESMIGLWREMTDQRVPSVFVPHTSEELCWWIGYPGVKKLAKRCREYSESKGLERKLAEPMLSNINLKGSHSEEIIESPNGGDELWISEEDLKN